MPRTRAPDFSYKHNVACFAMHPDDREFLRRIAVARKQSLSTMLRHWVLGHVALLKAEGRLTDPESEHGRLRALGREIDP